MKSFLSNKSISSTLVSSSSKDFDKDVATNHPLLVDDPFHQKMLKVAMVHEDCTTRIVQSMPQEAHSQKSPQFFRQVSNQASSKVCTKFDTTTVKRIRNLQSAAWNDRLRDLIEFGRQFGHLYVPNVFPANPRLSAWVKRQRYQYKLKQAGKHNTLTDQREHVLNQIGFVWDSHAALWEERFHDLKAFQKVFGHCNVPNTFQDRSLNIWCKHQRRQYNRSSRGLSSSMTNDRFRALNSIGFDWNPRNLKDY